MTTPAAPTRVEASRGLRLLNVASSIAPEAGGISEAIVRMSATLIAQGHEVETVTVDDPASPWAAEMRIPVHFTGPSISLLEHSALLTTWLRTNAGRFDAILTHGLWRYNSWVARYIGQEFKRPYFVFPHGMLDPWFKRKQPLQHVRKYAHWLASERAVLRDARAVLFTSEDERLSASKSFWPYRCAERVVYLGTATPPENEDEQRRVFAEQFPQVGNRRLILFLGRLRTTKGCGLLLRAFLRLLQSNQSAACRNVHLMIAGPCRNRDYESKLRHIAAACNAEVPGCVSLPGMLKGDVKWGAMRSAEAFILPSYHENFGFAVVEALACGTPVLISRAVNIWREIEASGACLVEEATLDGCTQLLQRWLALPAAEKHAMRPRAVACFQQNFEITQAAARLAGTIRSLLPAASPGARR